MSLRPLGNRLIVKPEADATISAGGIHIPQTAGKKPAMTGTVISVGRGPSTAHRVRQYTLAQVMDKLAEVAERVPSAALRTELEDEIARMAHEDVTFSEVKEGDYVCFPFTSGQNLNIDGESFIVMQEDDLEAVWTPEAEEVA
jgi:co-chaperonin GroES (HSP10)